MRALLIILLLWGLSIHGQEGKLRYQSFRLEGMTLYPHGKQDYIPVSGPAWSISFKAGKHILKYRYGTSSGTQPAKPDERMQTGTFFSFPVHQARDPSEYKEHSLFYGRSLRPTRGIMAEIYTGITHIDYTNQYHSINTKQLGIPFRSALNVYLNNRFALGINGGITLSEKHSNHYWSVGIVWNAMQHNPN